MRHTEVLYHEGGEALEWVAHRSYGCPLPGSAWATWSSRRCRCLWELDDLRVSFQPNPFYDSMMSKMNHFGDWVNEKPK